MPTQHPRTNRPRRRLACVAGLALAASLSILPLAGCGAQDATSAQTAGVSASKDATAQTAASSDGETRASSASSSRDASAASDAVSFSYSEGLTDDGYWEDVTALDHVTLPSDYASVSVSADDIAPSDEDVQAQVDSIVSNYAISTQVTDRAVANGDTVNIDYVGSIDGVEFDGGSTQGQGTTVTIGTTQYIDDFLDQLVGHKPGETFDVNVTFPDDYGVDELNGKDATFKTTINYISEQQAPDVTDEWVADNLKASYGWESVDAMEQDIRTNLQNNNLLSYLQEYVADNSEVSEMPQALLDYQQDMLLAQYQQYADAYGVSLEQMVQQVSGAQSVEALLEQNSASFESAAKNYLVYQAIAEDQGLSVSDDDVAAYFKTFYGTDDYSTYEEHYGMPYLKLIVLIQQVNDLLMEGSTTTAA